MPEMETLTICLSERSVKRIDFTLTGHGEAGEKNAVLVELRQWSSSKLSEKDAIVVTALGKGLNETVHPSYQAWSYASRLLAPPSPISTPDSQRSVKQLLNIFSTFECTTNSLFVGRCQLTEHLMQRFQPLI